MMRAEFVPLSQNRSTRSGDADFRVRVLPTTPSMPAFVPAQTPPREVPVPQHAPCAGSEPKVTLEKDGDRVTAIRIECGCGQVIQLACTY